MTNVQTHDIEPRPTDSETQAQRQDGSAVRGHIDTVDHWVDRCVRHLVKLDPSIWPEQAASIAAHLTTVLPWYRVAPEAVAARLYRSL